jgi:enterochelin esterase-like enzyme
MKTFRLICILGFIGLAGLLCAATGEAQVGMVNVTFDVTLPADTPASDTIYVAGNFQNWEPGATPLTRDSLTHAQGTVSVTQGSELEFKFTRGDWSRGEKAFDCNEIPNRTATASGQITVTATVANWADICVPNYDPRAHKVRINSPSLGVPKEFYVYTPPEYALAPERRYPVLYLFRGHEKEWINKFEDGSRGGTNVIDVYEELLAADQVGPMLLVFPGISSDDNSVSGMLTNFKSPELTTAAGIGTGRFEDYFVQDVIGYVDANYRTVATRAGRGVDGFSLGGFMSVKIASQHPELFQTAGAFDGTHFYADLDCSDVDAVRDANTFTTNAMFDPVFGKPRDTVFCRAE